MAALVTAESFASLYLTSSRLALASAVIAQWVFGHAVAFGLAVGVVYLVRSVEPEWASYALGLALGVPLLVLWANWMAVFHQAIGPLIEEEEVSS